MSGKASYDPATQTLKIALTGRKKRATFYTVEDVRPDPSVAFPAYALKKRSTGEVWHVWVDGFGAGCDCPSATFRGDRKICKHIKACTAVGLLPKE